MKDRPLKEGYCEKRVWDSTGWHTYQCQKKSVVERDGHHFCKIHDPEYVKAKEEKKDEKYKKESCKKCRHHFDYPWYKFCPSCGTKRVFEK